MTTALIVLPLAAALVVWLLPLPDRASAALALLAALAELVLWAVALAGFDFGEELQLEVRQSWFSDLGVSYHVGFFGWSLWLAGLTIVVSTAAIAYALGAGRERASAYHGLLLFLMGAVVGVFAAQDLVLFYVFWEVMLLPMYFLIGIWGGPRREYAAIKFFLYTLFGGVLMLMRYVGSLTSLLPVAAIWIGLNIFFGLLGGTPGAAGEQVAWTAHIGGFVYGLAAIRLFMPRQS